ncbi:MAG: hypothetical protein IJ649_05855 [Oscillospiraceae bacterium]|nr:hypothetical protein [Clostridia bacterium]MBR1566269.1 hypothetical protein [Oscillospiraceae bacterium]
MNTFLPALISPVTGEPITVSAMAVPADNMLYTILTIISGAFWTYAYIMIIYRGFKDKTSGMPLMVLGLNFAWEFIFGFLGAPIVPEGSLLDLSAATPVQRVWNCIWCLFDVAIVVQKFKYGQGEFKQTMPKAPAKLFYPYLIFIMVLSFAAVLTSVWEWNDPYGVYSAFIQNVFISAMFVSMLWKKGSSKGQSMGIAIFKFLGTVAPGLMGASVLIKEYGLTIPMALGDITFMPLMKVLLVAFAVFDCTYMISLYRMIKYREHCNPWTKKPLSEEEIAKLKPYEMVTADEEFADCV